MLDVIGVINVINVTDVTGVTASYGNNAIRSYEYLSYIVSNSVMGIMQYVYKYLSYIAIV